MKEDSNGILRAGEVYLRGRKGIAEGKQGEEGGGPTTAYIGKCPRKTHHFVCYL